MKRSSSAAASCGRRKRSSKCNEEEKIKMGISGGSVKKGPWTAEEDEVLSEFIKREGEGGWRTLPQRAGLLRCGKSCRLRWMNYLRPSVKRGQMTWDEEDLIVRMHRLLGNRWSLIAGRIPGRTDNEIKNYWNTHLSKKHGLHPRTHKPLLLINPPPPYTNPNNNNNNSNNTTVDDDEMIIPLPTTTTTTTTTTLECCCCDHMNNNYNMAMEYYCSSCSFGGDDDNNNINNDDDDVIVDENGVSTLAAFLNSLINDDNDCQVNGDDQLRDATPGDNNNVCVD